MSAPDLRSVLTTGGTLLTAVAICHMAGCTNPNPPIIPLTSSSAVPIADARATRLDRLSRVGGWLYQLQNLNPETVAPSDYDLLVTDYSRDGSVNGEWQTAEVSHLKQGGRIVLAYMSIGEAEDYRFYWRPEWDNSPRDGLPDADAPDWLAVGNAQWCDLPDYCNYKVRYWLAGWQEIVFGNPTAYLDRIMAAGFDGVYLDIIDAYEYFEEVEGRESAADDMRQFVADLANYARQQLPQFIVIAQNGEALSDASEYVQVIDGLGKESLFFNGEQRLEAGESEYSLMFIRKVREAGGIVLSVEYISDPQNVALYYSLARNEGLVPLATTRDLDSFVPIINK